MQCLPRGLQSIDERLFWELLDDWLNRPSQAKGHVARQRYGSALDDYTSISFLESPVRIQPPQEAVTRIGL